MAFYLIEGGFSTEPDAFMDAGIGTWNSMKRIAALTMDVSQTIEILIDNVILKGLKSDSASPVISTSGNDGIYIFSRNDITITNVEIANNNNGIYVDKSSNIIIRDNSIHNNSIGIKFDSANSSNSIEKNTIYHNGTGISFNTDNNANKIQDNSICGNDKYEIDFFERNNLNTIKNNKVSNNGHGIYLSLFNDSNNIYQNEISYNCKSNTGLYLDGSNNAIKYNSFINNNPNAINNGNDNIFYGNYWSDWDGCIPYSCNCIIDCHPRCPDTYCKSAFRQFSVEENLTIPEQKPCAEEILSCLVEVEITHVKVIKTPRSVSYEGQFLTGHIAIIEGKLLQKIEYVAERPTQQVHAAHFTSPFSTYIILTDNYIEGMKLHITPTIEDVFYKLVDKRCIFKNITLYFEARSN